MPDEDHRFKRIIIENEDEAAKTEGDKEVEDEDKINRFQWDDIEEETEGEMFEVSDEEINECVILLSSHLLTNIGTEHFAEIDTSGMRFVIPVDLDLHVLLRKRFEEEWNLDSRIEMFQCLRGNLSAEFNAILGESNNRAKNNRAKLDEKIQNALPSTHRKKFVSGEVSLEDDAMVVDDESNLISIEIPLAFAANS